MEGNFRLFKNENGYSLATRIDDENEGFFTKLGKRMAEIIYEQKNKIPKLFNPKQAGGGAESTHRLVLPSVVLKR